MYVSFVFVDIPVAFIALAIVNSLGVLEQVAYGVMMITACEDNVSTCYI